MNTIIGYSLYGQYNDTFMIDENSSLEVCPKCGYLKNFSYHNPFYKVKRKTYDFAHPYDVGTIVSLRFKEFCLRENYKGLIFKEFERSIGFFQFDTNNVVEFDAVRTGTQFEKYCDVCGNYEIAVGTTPPFLKNISNGLGDGFYKTNLVFGSNNRKNSITMVAPETYKKLKREKMKGLFFIPIHS
jgi:hypothetical protein